MKQCLNLLADSMIKSNNKSNNVELHQKTKTIYSGLEMMIVQSCESSKWLIFSIKMSLKLCFIVVLGFLLHLETANAQSNNNPTPTVRTARFLDRITQTTNALGSRILQPFRSLYQAVSNFRSKREIANEKYLTSKILQPTLH